MARLEQIASCESGGNPEIISSNGLYHGKYQFHPDTWRSVGGRGLPSEAPEVEQDYRAGLLLARSGPGQWPVCGAWVWSVLIRSSSPTGSRCSRRCARRSRTESMSS